MSGTKKFGDRARGPTIRSLCVPDGEAMHSPLLEFVCMVSRDIGSLFTTLSLHQSHKDVASKETYAPPVIFKNMEMFLCAASIASVAMRMAEQVCDANKVSNLRGRIGGSLKESMGIVTDIYASLVDAYKDEPRPIISKPDLLLLGNVVAFRSKPIVDHGCLAAAMAETYELELDVLLSILLGDRIETIARTMWNDIVTAFVKTTQIAIGDSYSGTYADTLLQLCARHMVQSDRGGLRDLVEMMWMGHNSPSFRGYDSLLTYAPYTPRTHGPLTVATSGGWSLFVLDGQPSRFVDEIHELVDTQEGQEMQTRMREATGAIQTMRSRKYEISVRKPSTWIEAFEASGTQTIHCDETGLATFMRENFDRILAPLSPRAMIEMRREGGLSALAALTATVVHPPETIFAPPKAQRRKPEPRPTREPLFETLSKTVGPSEKQKILIDRMNRMPDIISGVKLKDLVDSKFIIAPDKHIEYGLLVAVCSRMMRRLVMDTIAFPTHFRLPISYQLPEGRSMSKEFAVIGIGNIYGIEVTGAPGYLTLALLATSYVEGTRAMAIGWKSVAVSVMKRIRQMHDEDRYETKLLSQINGLDVALDGSGSVAEDRSNSVSVRVTADHFKIVIDTILGGGRYKLSLPDATSKFFASEESISKLMANSFLLTKALLSIGWDTLVENVTNVAKRLGDDLSRGISNYVLEAQKIMVSNMSTEEKAAEWIDAVVRFPTLPEFRYTNSIRLPVTVPFDLDDAIYPRSLTVSSLAPQTVSAPTPAPAPQVIPTPAPRVAPVTTAPQVRPIIPEELEFSQGRTPEGLFEPYQSQQPFYEASQSSQYPILTKEAQEIAKTTGARVSNQYSVLSGTNKKSIKLKWG